MTNPLSNTHPLSMIAQAHILGAFISQFELTRAATPSMPLQDFYSNFLSEIGKSEAPEVPVLNSPGQRLGILFMTIAFAKESFYSSFPTSFVGSGESEWGVIEQNGAINPQVLIRRLRNSITHGYTELTSEHIIFQDKSSKATAFDFSAKFTNQSIFILQKKIAIHIASRGVA